MSASKVTSAGTDSDCLPLLVTKMSLNFATDVINMTI